MKPGKKPSQPKKLLNAQGVYVFLLNLSFGMFPGFGLTTRYITAAELSLPPKSYDP
jgi:hypothetical protein